MTRIADVLALAIIRLEEVGTRNARRDAQMLLAAVLERDRAYVTAFSERELTPPQVIRFQSYIDRRAAHEPVSRILGGREFWSLWFDVTPDTLDPRPETETLVEVALDLYPQGVEVFVDVGTGTGCLAIALLTEWPTARAIAVDVCAAALTVARRNAARLGVADRLETRLGMWLEPIIEPVPLIVSNPPYIDPCEVLDPDVRLYDPALALFAERQGLAAYDVLWPAAAGRLTASGRAIMEIGWHQQQAVTALAAEAGFAHVTTYQDLGGRDRVVTGVRAANP